MVNTLLKEIAELEKENAELKNQLNKVCGIKGCMQLTKAKEIIKKLYPFVRDKCYTTTLSENKERQSLIAEAEQFLKGTEE